MSRTPVADDRAALPTDAGPARDAPGSPASAPPLLATGVAVHFGGVRALAGVDITVRHDEIVGLIGGNGAGKTTFMNCVSGYVDPEPGGSITAFGVELTGMAPEYRPFADVGRSYQAATLFPGLTVTETLLVAVERHNPSPVVGAILGSGTARRLEREKRAQVDQLMEATGLTGYRDRRVRELSTGTRRVVDLACVLAQRPGLLLLDEPTGGLAQRETEVFAPLIKHVQQEIGCAVMVIEHDMVMIGELCDRVYAMELGEVIAEGTPHEVRTDPSVIASYLGTDETAIARSGTMADEPDAVNGRAANGRATNGRRRPLQAGPRLEDRTRAELIERARQVGIRGRSGMRKADLVDALVHHEVERARAVRR